MKLKLTLTIKGKKNHHDLLGNFHDLFLIFFEQTIKPLMVEIIAWIMKSKNIHWLQP